LKTLKHMAMKTFEPICQSLMRYLEVWEPQLLALSEEIITKRKNSQNRSVRQILGHLVDSASNNTHRIVHLQYRENPMTFPNYATEGNNDRWIAIQDYQHENWFNLVQLWKFANLHLVHILRNVDESKLGNIWQNSESSVIPMKEMIEYYLPHFELHLREMEELIQSA
jgi:hypothetical protein